MKSIAIVLSLFFIFNVAGNAVSGGNKLSNNYMQQQGKKTADSVKVFGQCGMCKTRIEKAARSVSGVKTATWSDETKMLHLTFTGENKTAEVQKAVAKVGHDSPPYIATKAAYDALPGCCKYRD